MDWGAQHSFGVPISRGLVVSPHLVTGTVLGQGQSVHRKDSGHDAAAAPGGGSHVAFGEGLLHRLALPVSFPHFRNKPLRLPSRS